MAWHMIFPGCENIKIQFNMLPKIFVDSYTIVSPSDLAGKRFVFEFLFTIVAHMQSTLVMSAHLNLSWVFVCGIVLSIIMVL